MPIMHLFFHFGLQKIVAIENIQVKTTGINTHVLPCVFRSLRCCLAVCAKITLFEDETYSVEIESL